MIIDMQEQSRTQSYQWMTQAVVPRPIAWILTENDGGGFNLAPFSYFNALCSAPPLVGVSMSNKPGGGVKDTLRNIRDRRRFVVHIAQAAQLESLNESAATLDYGDSELDRLELATEPFGEMRRIAECPVAMACALHREISLDDGDDQKLILGEIELLYAADSAMAKDTKGRPFIDGSRIDPPARLSAGNYATLGSRVSLQRPD